MQISSNASLLSTLGQLTGTATPATPVKSASPVSVKAGDGTHQQATAAVDQAQSTSKATSKSGQRGSLLNVVV